jgi:hypothetical protein
MIGSNNFASSVVHFVAIAKFNKPDRVIGLVLKEEVADLSQQDLTCPSEVLLRKMKTPRRVGGVQSQTVGCR